VASEHLGLAVSAAEDDPGALLHHYRRVIAFRHAQPALKKGTIEALKVEGDVISFIRRPESKGDGDAVYFALNMGEEPATLAPPDGTWSPAGLEINSAQPGADGNLHLAHWQPCIMLATHGRG
jgi:alpha-glucosidase